MENRNYQLAMSYKINTVQAELVKTALNDTHKAGLKVWRVTCDSAYPNLSTMKIFVCKIGDNYE